MARRSGLGRGLGALIPTEVLTDRPSGLVELPLGAVVPNPRQPRTHFDEELLAGLAASIREMGVLQPILVRALQDGQHELIAGERRWRAAKRAGLQTIPALVRTTDNAASLEQALVENLHRQDLNPLEEAGAYQQLIEDFGLTHEEVGARVGKSRAAVSNTLRLLQLPPTVQRLVADGQLSAGHARALLGTPDRSFQEGLARRAVTEDLSVRAVEDAVRLREDLSHQVRSSSPIEEGTREELGGKVATATPAGLMALEELLAGFLETRVKINLRAGRGKVTITFADLDDLERIYRLMTQSAK